MPFPCSYFVYIYNLYIHPFFFNPNQQVTSLICMMRRWALRILIVC